MAEVVLKNVSKTYPGSGGGVEAVRSADLVIADQEFLVLVGPSGCGKSTTLRMIAGLEEVTSGTVTIGDRVVNDVPPKDRDIAMVFQNYALYPHMTVYDNMAFGLKLRGYSKEDIDTRVQEATAILGIQDLHGRNPTALSGGQRQRVAGGRAIARKPGVFRFDEHLSNLDAKLRVEMRAELKKLHQRLGTTMIYVTHDQVEAMTLGDRIVIMDGGVIRQVGSPLEVYDRPASKFVAGFVGTPAMNFLEGHIEGAGEACTWTDGQSTVELPPELSKRVSEYAGRGASLGIRPEDVLFDDGIGSIPARVEVLEPLGNEMIVYVATDKQKSILVRSEAHRDVSVGMEVNLSVKSGKIHVFDDGSGTNLTADSIEAEMEREVAGAGRAEEATS